VFQRILVANRGEIALRVLRAAREMDIDSVAVYSEADADAAYLDLADEKICIGPAASGASYLSIAGIISAAEVTDVDAIHPGYGFLSENAEFAQTCADHAITFIGPDAKTMSRLGDKATARALAMSAKVPVVPGSEGLVSDEKEALVVAQKIGYPVLIKATAGGGGRGMRVAHNNMTLVTSFHQAGAEAQQAFGEGGVYVEKFVENPRHVEVQILADGHGNLIHLGTRDCSVQRRHQKLLEEAPAPGLTDSMRRNMGRAALRIAKSAGYKGAGTVEFLVKGKEFYYQKAVKIRGHAIEVRINAEDPARGFRPSPGLVTRYVQPGGPGVRVDTHIYAGYRVPPTYDSLLGKLIVHAPDRQSAISRLARALDEFGIDGIKTTIPLHQEIVRNAFFRRGGYDTGFLAEYFSV